MLAFRDALTKGQKTFMDLLRAIDIRLVISSRARCAKTSSRAHDIPMELMYDGIVKLNTSTLIPRFQKGVPQSNFCSRYLVATSLGSGELNVTTDVASYEPKIDSWIWSTHTKKRSADDYWITTEEHHKAFYEAVLHQASVNRGYAISI